MASLQASKTILGQRVGTALPACRVSRISNNTVTKVSAKVNAYIAEVIAREMESPDNVVNRFSGAVRRTGVFHEVRRRQRFECKQDMLKRKMREKGFKKKQLNYTSYEQAVEGGFSVPPFADMYDDGEDDLFGQGGYFSNAGSKREPVQQRTQQQ